MTGLDPAQLGFISRLHAALEWPGSSRIDASDALIMLLRASGPRAAWQAE
jgi:hypothetical protein